MTRGPSASLFVQKLQSTDVLYNKYLQKRAGNKINVGEKKHIMHPNLKRFYSFLQGLQPKSVLPNIDMEVHMHASLHSCVEGPPQPQEWNSSPQIFKPYAQCRQSGRTRRKIRLCDRSFPLVQHSKIVIWSFTALGVITVKLQQNLPECAWSSFLSSVLLNVGPRGEWSALIFNSTICSLCHITFKPAT